MSDAVFAAGELDSGPANTAQNPWTTYCKLKNNITYEAVKKNNNIDTIVNDFIAWISSRYILLL